MFNKTNLFFLGLYVIIVLLLTSNYPVNPIAFDLYFFDIKWYGLLFSATILMARFKMGSDIKRIDTSFGSKQADNLILYSCIGMVLGARFFYLVFYQYDLWILYLKNPLLIIDVRQGGLSFHGGLIGLVIGVILFCTKNKISFIKCMDVIALTVPIGLAEGRIGNFINGELWGKVTNLPVGLVFPSGGPLARHPTQLYESFLEGVVFFFILKAFSQKQRQDGSICGMFLLMYSIFRFLIEFVREPDSNLGYLAWDWLTMGQVLCVPMFIIGIFLIFFYKRNIFTNKCIVLK
jgi:phosphatidylglycerol:prolipoprotein diacylglycerol transferase